MPFNNLSIDKIATFGFIFLLFAGATFAQPVPYYDSDKQAFGYRDPKSGKTRIKPQFEKASHFAQNLAKVQLQGQVGLIDSRGRWVVANMYADLGWSSDTSAIAPPKVANGLIGYQIGGLWGLLDVSNKGRTVKTADFVTLYPFQQGVAVASTFREADGQQRYGLIDRTGAWLISPDYVEVAPVMGQGGVLVRQETTNNQTLYGLFNLNGQPLLAPEFTELLLVAKNWAGKNHQGLWGLYNAAGEPIFPHELSEIMATPAGIVAKRFHAWGMLSETGSISHAFMYREPPRPDTVLQHLAYPKATFQDFDKTVQIPVYADSVTDAGEGAWLLHRNGEQMLRLPNGHEFDLQGLHWLQNFSGGLALVKQGSHFGALHIEGQMVLNPTYDTLILQPTGHIWAKNHKGKTALFDTQGRNLTHETWQAIYPFRAGAFRLHTDKGWQYVNAALQPLAGGQIFAQAQDFKESGLAAVKTVTGFWGIIDRTGRFVISPVADSLHVLSDQVFWVKDNGTYGTLSPAGIELFRSDIPFTLSPVGQGLMRISQGKYQGLLNAYGSLVVPVAYDSVGQLTTDGMLPLTHRKQLRYVDPVTGEIPPLDVFKGVQVLRGPDEKRFAVMAQGKAGFLDAMGRIYITPQYDSVTFFSEGMAGFKLNRRWGYVNTLNRIAIQPLFEEVFPFEGGTAVVRSNGKYGLIGTEGKFLIPANYDAIERTTFGNYLLRQSDKQGLFIRELYNGIYPRFDEVQDLGNGTALVRQGDRYGVSRLDGQTLIYPEHSYITFLPGSNGYLIWETSQH